MIALALALALSTPVYPYDDTIAMRVTQDNVLTWDVTKTPEVIDSWRLKCRYGLETVERVITNKGYSISFGSLSLNPGVYTHCGFTATNRYGDSAPYPVANFEYRTSYWPITKLTFEVLALFTAVSTIGIACKRQLRALANRTITCLWQPKTPQVLLPDYTVEPLIETQKVTYDTKH